MEVKTTGDQFIVISDTTAVILTSSQCSSVRTYVCVWFTNANNRRSADDKVAGNGLAQVLSGHTRQCTRLFTIGRTAAGRQIWQRKHSNSNQQTQADRRTDGRADVCRLAARFQHHQQTQTHAQPASSSSLTNTQPRHVFYTFLTLRLHRCRRSLNVKLNLYHTCNLQPITAYRPIDGISPLPKRAPDDRHHGRGADHFLAIFNLYYSCDRSFKASLSNSIDGVLNCSYPLRGLSSHAENSLQDWIRFLAIK